MKLGDKIKVVRLLTGEGQRELANFMGMKAPTHINRWEQGVSVPRANMLKKLGDSFNIHWPWLLDSNLDFVKSNDICFRPLSPYTDYTARWLSLLPQDLAELLPVFFDELCFEQYCCFEAPCNGGVIVASKPTLSCMIVCRPELYPKLKASASNCKLLTISDHEFAEQLFRSSMTQVLLERCGITSVKTQEPPSPPPLANLSLKLSAKTPADTNLSTLKEKIQQHIDLLIENEKLLEVECSLSVLPAKSSNELVADLVVGAEMKKLAKLLTKGCDEGN